MSNHRKQKLENIISRGIFHMIFVYGVFVWGLLTGILVTAINFFIRNKPLVEAIGLNLLIYPVAGIFFGLFMWLIIKNRYNRIRDDEL